MARKLGGRGETGGLSTRQFLAVACLFWVYVTVSNLLYGYSMRTGTSHVTTVTLFAPWDARLLQHVLLLPLLLVSFWASQRVQWRPLMVALPLQLMLGGVFALMAYPAMIFANAALGLDDLQEQLSHVHHWDNPILYPLWVASFVNFLPAYGFGLALVTGLALYARIRDSELRVAALQREWNAARLAALRMQLSPHTLFNLLHTIRGHIEWDPAGAQSMVVQLADLLRRLLNAGEQEFSRLGDELHFANLYLELQQRRFTDRLQVELPAQSGIPAVWVPSLILQPLVENAVVHGMAGHQGPVRVAISVSVAAGVLKLRVVNTVTPDRTEGRAGIGLKNVRERIAVQFEGRASLTAALTTVADDAGRNDDPGGTQWCSELTLPVIEYSQIMGRAAAAPRSLPAGELART